MLSDTNKVLIVVSDDYEVREQTSPQIELETKYDGSKTMMDPPVILPDPLEVDSIPYISEQGQPCPTHLSLIKNNSYPLESKQKDLLSVPQQPMMLLNNDDTQSIYSSNSSIDSMYCDDCANEFTLRKSRSVQDCFPDRKNEMKCASAHNLHNTGSLTPKGRFGNSRPDNNHPHIHRTNSAKSKPEDTYTHKSLKRTISAPLKTSKDDVTQADRKNIKDTRNRQQDSPSGSNHQGNYFNIFSPRVWKRSFLKMNEEKGASRFSLRRTFSLRSSASGHNGEGGHISFPSKKKKTQKYRIVESKTGQPDGISFELLNKQGCFLRVKGSELIPDRDNGSDSNFNKDVTFVPLPDMWFSSFFAFESVSKPSYFIRLLSAEEELVIDKYDGSKTFKEDASFRLSKKPDATCLKKDVQAWVKSSTGEYYLGKILFVNDDMVKVEFNDGRQERCLRSEAYKLIPDIVPCPSNLRVGTRVISQFGHRHRFYPGVISSVRRNDSFDILFDDGDFGRGKSYQMRLLKNFPATNKEDGGIGKENKQPTSSSIAHPKIKAVLSDPLRTKSLNQDWPKFDIDSPTHSDNMSESTSPNDIKVSDSLESTGSNDIIHDVSTNHVTTNNNNDNTVKPSSSFPFSKVEIENYNQDACFHDNKIQNHQNCGPVNDKHWFRRRKHGWIPSPLATDLKSTDSGNEIDPVALNKNTFWKTTPPLKRSSPLLAEKRCQNCRVDLNEMNPGTSLNDVLNNSSPGPIRSLRKSTGSTITKSFSEEDDMKI